MEVKVFVEPLIDHAEHQLEDSEEPHCSESTQDSAQCDNSEKHGAIWTSSATSVLLKLYESKLEMLETPKKKRRIWLAISECLKDHNINMSPDQVRWKINALTRKYKKCVDTGAMEKFKYFKDMNQIYSKYNIDSYGYTISEILDTKKASNRNDSLRSESKAIIELRKIRLANRLESDRSQAKIHMERQWLEYLNRKLAMKLRKDEFVNRSLKLKEQEIMLRQRELELKQSLEFKKMQLKEKDLEEILQVEKDKCELLKQILHYAVYFI